MSRSASQISSLPQNSPTCDAWAVVSFANTLGVVTPQILTNQSNGISNPLRTTIASGKIAYTLSLSETDRFMSGAYVTIVTPQISDSASTLNLWNVYSDFLGDAPTLAGQDQDDAYFNTAKTTLTLTSHEIERTVSTNGNLARITDEAKTDYKANIAVFSLATDSRKFSTNGGVTGGTFSIAGEGGFGRIGETNTSSLQNIGLFDEQKRVAAAYGTIVIPARKNASTVVAYMEDGYNSYGSADGYKAGISAGGLCTIDVQFTKPLDNADYCVILSREQTSGPSTVLDKEFAVPYIRGEKTRNGFRVEVARLSVVNGVIEQGVTSDFYGSGFSEKIHFMVFGGTDERIASFTSTERAWTTNPNADKITVANGPADYEVYAVAWTDPDYGRDGSAANSSALYTTRAARDADATRYAGFYTSTGGATYANAFEYARKAYSPETADPSVPSFESVNVNFDAATTGGLNAIQAGIRSIVPLFIPYLSGKNILTPDTVTGRGSIANNVDAFFGITFTTDEMIYRTIDRMKTVPVGKRHIYPRFIATFTPSQAFNLSAGDQPYTVLQHYMQMDGVTWNKGKSGVTSSGYRIPSKTPPNQYWDYNIDYTNAIYSDLVGGTAYNGVLISESFPVSATGITLTGPANGLTLYHNDYLWFTDGSTRVGVLVDVPGYDRLGVFTAAAGENKRIPVQSATVTVSGTVGGGYSACNVERSIYVMGGTFAVGRTLAPIFTDNAAAFAGNALKNYLDRVEEGIIGDRPVGSNTLANARFEYIDDDVENITPYTLYYSGQDTGITWNGKSNQQHRTYFQNVAFNSVQPNRKSVSLFDDVGVPAGLCGTVNYKDPEWFMGTINDPRIRTYKFEVNGITNDGSPTVASMFMDIYNQLCANFGTYYRGVINPGLAAPVASPAYPEPVSGVPAAITLGDISGVTYIVYNAYNASSTYRLPERKKYVRSAVNYLGGGTRTDDDPGNDPARDTLNTTTRINGADRGGFSPYNMASSYPTMTWTYILRALCEGHYRSMIHNIAKNRSWGVMTCGNYLQEGPVNVSEALFSTSGNGNPSIAPVQPEDVTCSPNFYSGGGVTAAGTYYNLHAAASYFPNPGNNYSKKYLYGGVPIPALGYRRVAQTVPEPTSTTNYGGAANAYDYTNPDGTIRFYHRLGLRHGSNPDWFGGIRDTTWFGITAGSANFVRGASVSHAFNAGATAITAWVNGSTIRPGDYVWFGRFGATVFNYITAGNIGTANQIAIQFHNPIGFTGSTGDTFLHEAANNNAGFVGFINEFRNIRAYQRSDPVLWKHFAPWISSPRLGPSTWSFNMDRRYWWELMYHLILAGAHHLIQWCDSVEFEAGDRRDHDLIYIHTMLNNWRNISGNSKCAEPVVTDYPSLSDKVFISGARIQSGPNAGLYIWRLTVRPGLLDETVTLTQNTRADLPATLTVPGGIGSTYPHGTRGVWLITKSSVKPEYTIAPASPDAFDSIALAKDQYYPIIFFYNEGGYANDVAGATWANWTGTSVACFQGDPLSASESRAYPWNANPSDLNNTPWHNLVYEQVIDAYKWGARSFHLYLPYGGYARDVYASTYGASAGGNFLLYQQFKDGYTLPSPAGLTHQQPARWKGFPQAINALLTGTMVPPNTQRTPITEPCNVYLYLPGLMGWSNYRRHSCAIWRGLPGTTAEKDAAFYAKLDSMVDVIKSMKPSSPTGKGKLSVNLDVARSTATPESVYLYRTVGDSTAPSASFSGAYLTDALELSDWYVKRKLEAAGIPVFIESRPFNRMNQVLISPTATGISGAVGVTASTGWQGEFVTSDEPWFWGSTNPQNYSESIKRSEIRHLHRMNPQGFRLSDIVVRGASSDPFGIYHTIARGNSFLNFWRGDASLGAGGFTADGDRTQYTPIAAVAHLYALSDHYRHYTNLKNGNSALKGVCFANFNSIGFALSEFKKGGERLVEAQGTNETKYARYSDIHPTAWPVWKNSDVFNGASFDANPRTYATDHQTKFWTANGKQFWQNNVMTSNFNDFITMLSTFSATAAPAFATAQGWAGATYPFDYYSRNTIGAALGLSLGGTNEVN